MEGRRQTFKPYKFYIVENDGKEKYKYLGNGLGVARAHFKN